ncbi:hypothetical protein ACOMHN_006567 [Nucella lapillus]
MTYEISAKITKEEVPSRPAAISDEAIAHLPQMEINQDLDNIPTEEEEKEFVDLVVKHSDRAHVVILIARERQAAQVVKAVARKIKPETLLWIANEGWAKAALMNTEINHFLLGSLLISLKEAAVPDFDRWLSQRKPVSV